MIKFFTPHFPSLLLLFSLSIVPFAGFTKGGLKIERIKQFVPEGYEIFDTAVGDFNADGYTDCVIVLKSNNEDLNTERPLLVLAGMAKGKFELVARNDKAVLCAKCGGVFGDPYAKVSIKDSVISILHSVGGNWQWSREINFKYSAELKEILLDKDTITTYQKSAPTRKKTVATNKSDFGNLTFSAYSYNKGF